MIQQKGESLFLILPPHFGLSGRKWATPKIEINSYDIVSYHSGSQVADQS